MPKDPKQREGLEKTDETFLHMIDEFGWHVTKVLPLVGNEGADSWAYSTGIYYHFQHPEIIVFNQKDDLMHSMINTIGERVRAGEKFEPGCGYAEIIGNFDCQFMPVDVTNFKQYVGWSIWFYDHDASSFPMLQCFWPDMKGKFPWESECADWAVKAQPLLYKPQA